MAIGQQIKRRREELGLTQEELARKIGYRSKSTINKIELGINDIPQKKIVEFANALNTTVAELMEWEDSTHFVYHPSEKAIRALSMPESNSNTHALTTAIRIPVLGRVAAGIPLDAIQEIIDWEELDPKIFDDGEYFALRIHGDSMEPKISNGDVVIVRRQEDADDGDLVIAIINGNDGVCKRLRKYGNGEVALISTNPAYDPLYFSRAEIDSVPVQIIGKVKELRAKF